MREYARLLNSKWPSYSVSQPWHE